MMEPTRNILFVYFMIAVGTAVVLTSDLGSIHEINVCREEHELRCQEGELISLVDIFCKTNRRSESCLSSVDQTLRRLCEGQQTCSSLGLKNIFSTVCRDDGKESIQVKFRCHPGSTSACRSNICADTSPGLRCPAGSSLHIRRMSCTTLSGHCSPNSYTSPLICEGADRCGASGLKTLLSEYCQDSRVWARNVFIDYVCVPEKQIEDRCSSTTFRRMDYDFGIIRLPSSSSQDTMCRWAILQKENNPVTVIIHLVTAKFATTKCNAGFVNIQYIDCNTRTKLTQSLCDVSNASVKLTSCGQVRIIVLEAEKVDKFIVSYHRHDSAITNIGPPGLPSCLPPPVVKITQTSPRPKSTHSPGAAIPISHNFGPADGMFDYRDSSLEDENRGTVDQEESSSLSKQLKLMILYIFFGVVILVLAVALIAVIISYHRISKFKGRRGDSSEKTALWQQHEDTPLDTFQHNAGAEGSGSLTSETTYAFRPDHNADQVIATVHHDAIAENDEYDHRLSSGSGISTFLGGKRDSDFRDLINTFQTGSFAVYSTLGDGNSSETSGGHKVDGEYYEVPDSGHYELPSNGDINNIYEVIDRDNRRNSGRSRNRNSHSLSPESVDAKIDEENHHLVSNHDQQPLVSPQYSPSDDLHYRINNDEYAIVHKSRKASKPPKIQLMNEDQRLYENCSDNGNSVDFHPTSGPYDQKRNSGGMDARGRWSRGERWTEEL